MQLHSFLNFKSLPWISKYSLQGFQTSLCVGLKIAVRMFNSDHNNLESSFLLI